MAKPVKSDLDFENVTRIVNLPDASSAQHPATKAQLDLKAPIDAPTFTTSVTLPGDPGSALQAATKQYVDGLIANVGKRARVRAATTANITISTALNNGDTLDGVTLATGDLVLVKDQSTAAQNGIIVVGVSPARDAQFDTFNEHSGSLIAVEEGSTNADTLWLCTSNDGGTLGTTAITFNKMVIAGELLAGNNLSDLNNASTARTNLGLGGAAVLSVGTTTGTVAAGDDGRFPVDSGQTLRTFFPRDNEPPASNFATFSTRNGHSILVFPDAVTYAAIFTGIMPAAYAGGGITVEIEWMSSGTSTNKVCFGAYLERVDVGTTDFDSDSFATEGINTAGVAGNATSGKSSKSSISFSNGTAIDSIAAGDAFRLKIARETGQANDTNTGDIQVLAVRIKEQ